MMKILVVEDEPKVSSFLKNGLEELSFNVHLENDGVNGLNAATHQNFDVIVLDINLPLMNGFEICAALRKNNITTPVLMLTALGTTDDKIQGFESGADDYLPKPFEFRELVARLKALGKRNLMEPVIQNRLRIADLELDMDQKIALRGNKKIDLTAKEFALLEFFIKNKGKVVSRVDIAEKVWDINFDTGTNVIDVYVNFLRKKIDKDFDNKLINTVVGMGYIMKDNS